MKQSEKTVIVIVSLITIAISVMLILDTGAP